MFRPRTIALTTVSATVLVLAAAGPAAAQAPAAATGKLGFMSNSSHTSASAAGAALETIARKN